MASELHAQQLISSCLYIYNSCIHLFLFDLIHVDEDDNGGPPAAKKLKLSPSSEGNLALLLLISYYNTHLLPCVYRPGYKFYPLMIFKCNE